MELAISLHALTSSAGIGLMIGAVRERAERGSGNSFAGVRTHLLVALAGTLGAALGTAVLVSVLALLGVLCVVAYLRGGGGIGVTGEVAIPLTALLAALALSHPGFAAGVAVVVAAALYANEPLHELVRERLSEQELRDGLLLAGAALVVLPLLPDESVDPWGVIVPSKLWRLVVLILAVGMAGHVAQRVIGARWGLPLAGFLAGFASSTAAVMGFGQRARQQAAHVAPAASGALFANLGSLALFASIVGTGAPQLMRHMAVPLAVGGVLLAALAFFGVLRRDGLTDLPGNEKSRAFRVSHALLLVGLMAVLLVASALLRERFGSAGVLVAAAAVAIVEVHAAAASLAELASVDALSPEAAGWGLVLLVLVAGLSKSGIAFVSGGTAYGWRVATGLLAMPLVMALTLWFASHNA